MSVVIYILIITSVTFANNKYCNLSETQLNKISTRQFYNIGDIISEEDQMYNHEVCYSDGNYNVGSSFKLADYAGNIILISMNATW